MLQYQAHNKLKITEWHLKPGTLKLQMGLPDFT